jgi:hypothetical protein
MFYLASYAFGIFIRLIVCSSVNYIKSRKINKINKKCLIDFI